MLQDNSWSRSILLWLGALVLTFGCAQRKGTTTVVAPEDPRWQRIDSLEKAGLFASALEIAQQIKADAESTNDWRTEFRALMHTARYKHLTGTDQEQLILELENELDTTITDSLADPLQQLLHSVLAESYWNYYQENRWRILDRTNVAEAPAGSGISTWDQRMFMRRVIDHAKASLEPFGQIRHIPAAELGELLEWPLPSPKPKPGDPFTRSGKFEEPLLIDILARRAIGIFINSEMRIAEPAWKFTIDDPVFFSVYENFTQRQLEHRDSLSWEFQALRTWQRWEHAHLSDNDPILLTDVMLDRLRYVKDNSSLPEKDTLYYNALLTISDRVEQHAVWAEVNVAIAHWHVENSYRFQRLDPEEFKWEKRTAVTLLDSAIARFPDSFGARKAIILKTQLTLPTIDLKVEEAVIRDQPFKIALGYTNVPKVWLRIVKDEADVQEQQRWGTDQLKWLLQRPVVREWSVELPTDGDLNQHLVELPVEALPHGRYAILASHKEEMGKDEDQVAFTSFWSTRIAVAERSHNAQLELLMLDRSTGRALNEAKAELYIRDNVRGDRNFTLSGDIAVSEGRASADLKKNSMNTRWRITLPDGDRFITSPNWSYYHQGGEHRDSIRTFLFTDRAIYRPGQDVFFKGITTVARNNTTVVKAGYSTIAEVFDANGELVDSLTLISDEFGSFHGMFKAPAGLTGHMRIETDHGSVGFQVEEYKRPTFEVVFDPVKTTAKLNEEAEVTGVARSYAGVPLNDAEVNWVVRRMARMPWWSHDLWRGFPGWGRPVEIASGTDSTNAEGHFNINFIATADKQLPRRADPIFVYTIEANVTDITGETQTNNTSLSLGYKGIEIELKSDAINRSNTDSLSIDVRNLNGERVARPVDIRIHRLKAPTLPLRDRKWEQPDRHVMSEEAHAALFPFDPYANENDPRQWERDSLVLERTQWNSKEHRIELTNIDDWVVGPYLIELITTDQDGTEVKVEKPITIFDHQIQNTGFLAETFHVEQLDLDSVLEPGDKAKLLLSTALGEGRIGMEVERQGVIAATRWFNLSRSQQLIELPILEEDRGGFAVHFIAVAHGREFRTTTNVVVPWTNKELKVEWMSFRDKMLPGAKEEFRLKISGPNGDNVAAQLLATMYDASLDHFVPHTWQMFQWPPYTGTMQWTRMEPFDVVSAQAAWYDRVVNDTTRVYPSLKTFGWPVEQLVMYEMMVMDAEAGEMAASRAAPERQEELKEVSVNGVIRTDSTRDESSDPAIDQVTQPVRSDFRETAFFLPDLLTDRDGSVILKFTMPDALTRWKFMGLAHTTDLKLAQFDREVITQKPLMVVPNLPRFLRQGDRITLMSKTNALEGDSITGSISLELFDPYSDRSIGERFNLNDTAVSFTAAPGASGLASWTIQVPEQIDMVGIRIIARGDNGISDGEEHVLPVLSDKMLVTESLPISINKAGTKTFTLDKLKNNTSNTLQHQSLKLEFTPNPAWYAVQALPYLIEYPHECSEQIFSRYYANTLAAHIVEERPGILKVVEAWRASAAKGVSDLLSALEKNPELKSILLEETPWVMQARNEGERKANLILLFDMERMAAEEAASLKKLRELQRPDGSWPWFGGMFPSQEITQHIVAGIGHLKKLNASHPERDPEIGDMLDRAIAWMDQQAEQHYKRLKKDLSAEQLNAYVPGYTQLQYLYARSFFTDRPFAPGAAQAATFFQKRISVEWLKYGLQEQAMISLALDRLEGDGTDVPNSILRSLNERATRDEELGMYWKNFSRGMEWSNLPTETHALLIEAFHEIAHDTTAVNGLRQYLLKLKQTTDWRTTKATANACYALLLTGSDLLEEAPPPQIMIGGEQVKTDQQEAGTGYFAQTWGADRITPEMGTVSITTTSDRISWGALHWQYFEQMDKITPHDSPFNIRKEVMLRRQTEEGARLLTLGQAGGLVIGDRLTIRIELRTDRYVDYVHLKDLRAAGLEPVEAISGFKWQGGLGYYQSIRDAGMHFFFDRIPPGTHVFEYELNVSQAGDFSNGITSAMCMYAPEFSSHSAGQRIVIGME